jgi:hypothetical protein
MKIVAALVLCGFLTLTPAPAQSPTNDPEFKTVHLLNFKSPDGEQKLLSILREFNDLFVKLGHPQIRYRVWKVAAEPRGRTRYLWESTWPSRALYQKVHNLPEYRTTFDRLSPQIAQLMSDHIYDQYLELK